MIIDFDKYVKVTKFCPDEGDIEVLREEALEEDILQNGDEAVLTFSRLADGSLLIFDSSGGLNLILTPKEAR